MNYYMPSRHHALVLLLINGVMFFCAHGLNRLDDIFHHQGIAQVSKRSIANTHDVELGQVVLYFSEKGSFTMERAQDKADGRSEYRFFWPVHEISINAKKSLAQGAVFETEWYDVIVEHVHDGIQLRVSFNPHVTQFFYAWFDSIGDKHKGWVFRFFDKKKLHGMTQPRPVLETVENRRKPRVIIDCGHGGTDRGAQAFGLVEKNLTLDIGQRVAHILKREGCDVFMTRASDVTMPLDARTSFANRMRGDLCVSIHANAGGKNARGIETYCLNEGLLRDAVFYPHRSSTVQEFNRLLADRRTQSVKLAQSVQENVFCFVKKKRRTSSAAA